MSAYTPRQCSHRRRNVGLTPPLFSPAPPKSARGYARSRGSTTAVGTMCRRNLARRRKQCFRSDADEYEGRLRSENGLWHLFTRCPFWVGKPSSQLFGRIADGWR